MGDELRYGFVMPLFPLFPVLAIVAQTALAIWLVHISPIAWIIAPIWVASGLVLYLVYSRSRAVTTEDEILVFEERPADKAENGKYRVMVAVANPENALQMVRTTYKVCGAKDAGVELLHMVPVPAHVPLHDAEKYMFEGKEGIIETMLYLAPMFPLSTTLRYCRSAARGIVTAVRQKHTDLLILGWRGRSRRGRWRMGSTLDPVIEMSPCNVAVLKDCGGDRKFRRVLVPVVGGPNSLFAMEMASILAEADGSITAFTIANPKRPFDLGEFLIQAQERLHLPPDRIEGKVAPSQPVAKAILKEAEEYDLIVLGCTQEPLLRQLTHETLPEMVARRCSTPVVMVKAAVGIRSWLRRWI